MSHQNYWNVFSASDGKKIFQESTTVICR